MKPIRTAPNLTDQAYTAIADEICDGVLLPGTHLVQEELAERLGVSRQPVQQAMALLKADGLVAEVGRRGLRVSELDLNLMRHHYDIRAVLDGLAARGAAERARLDPAEGAGIGKRGDAILHAAEAAIAMSAIRDLIRHDEAFHNLLYDASGNPLLARTAEPHWRFLRRAMGDVLRHAAPAEEIWRQHAEILEAVVAGDVERAEDHAMQHVLVAADTLVAALADRMDGLRPPTPPDNR